ncbi:5'-nucleotidase C-terminal domain-containing protein [Neorhizobium galegae]|uniref:5'-nucleotidase C-terminal domain-containing protein n=1 Tax=Neorhizobium galegae TaxID=399 RepID=UPI0012864007|nr:5'-nucleotidase C-terminal domain-containing protein [Neorhizobium galegae]KAA9388236.1 LysM peptidoglycan-binding domain-containing protein [Neorhizobium galegae]MCM2501229.1 5'-nucleotidase C-terminal domain-containing protein [Neorhizobium galegae]
MKKTLRFGLLTASVMALSSGVALADFELNILHINDFHSRLESINATDSTCSAEDEGKGVCFGGAARLLTAINQTRAALKAENKNVILLNGGDNFQGSLFYTTYKGAAEAEALNAMKFDAMTVGNHEFDDSDDVLATFLDKIQFPVVTANVVPSAAAKIGNRIKPSLVLTVGGQKVGIVGAVTNDTAEIANPGPNITIADDVAKITEAVQGLKAQGVDKIIALTHVGYPRDLALIAKIPDVDVVVGGHTHTLLSNVAKGAEGPYPTWSDNPGGYKVPVVQAYQYSKYLGDIKIVFDDSGVVKSAEGEPILMDKSITPDPVFLARVAELKKPIEDMKKKVVGASEAVIDGDRRVCRAKECSMGNLVADAMLDRTKGQGIAIAIQNGGGLRASIDAGEVTQGEVVSVLPFQNTLATFQLTGADVVKALENGVSQIDDGAGRFPQVAGLKYSFDKSKPAGAKVSDVQVKEGDKFVPIDPAKTYGVVTNNFMRAGGDGYAIFKTGGKNAYDYGPDLADVTAEFVAARNPYKPYTDGRITDLTPVSYTPPPKPAPAAPPAAAPAPTAAAPATPAPATPAPAAPAPTMAAPAAPAPAAPAPTVAAPAASAAPAPNTMAAAPAAPKPAAPAPAAPAPNTMAAAPATPAATAAKPAGPTKYTVVKGDSLWKIAEATYGDGEKWTEIAKLNSLRHPNVIQVGAELELPAK